MCPVELSIIGPLVGTRTWGGLVGIWDVPGLVDGGRITAPRGGFYDTDGNWAVENEGVAPDIEVAMDPKLVKVGRDPQLEAAVTAALADREFRGRLVESAVGAHLANAAAGECELFYWREGSREVDFIVRSGREITAIEVKSGRAPAGPPGLAAYEQLFRPRRTLVVGDAQLSVEEFLAQPVARWIEG